MLLKQGATMTPQERERQWKTLGLHQDGGPFGLQGGIDPGGSEGLRALGAALSLRLALLDPVRTRAVGL